VKLRIGDAHQIYVCAKSQFTDPPRKDLSRKNADADRQEQWPRRYQDGARKGRNREWRRKKGRRY
jgi:hypothetical protein